MAVEVETIAYIASFLILIFGFGIIYGIFYGKMIFAPYDILFHDKLRSGLFWTFVFVWGVNIFLCMAVQNIFNDNNHLRQLKWITISHVSIMSVLFMMLYSYPELVDIFESTFGQIYNPHSKDIQDSLQSKSFKTLNTTVLFSLFRIDKIDAIIDSLYDTNTEFDVTPKETVEKSDFKSNIVKFCTFKYLVGHYMWTLLSSIVVHLATVYQIA